MLRSMLLFGETILINDNIFWAYPVFQFFAENIINNNFPLWDPFNFGGEPFYPLIMQVKLLEPITLLTIYLGQFISNDIVMLFNWNHFLKSLAMLFGVYMVFRPIAEHLFIRLSLIPILLYSSFMLVSFRQPGILDQFLWIPFIAYFLLRILYYKDCRWHNWLLLSALIGLNWQSHSFAAAWIFLLFFFLGIVFFRRDLLIELFKTKMIALKFSIMLLIIFVMALPNIILLVEKGNYVFPTKFADASSFEGQPMYERAGSSSMKSDINMSYSFITHTGGFTNIWDFIQIISPDGNKNIRGQADKAWGSPTEAYIYLGILTWAVALLGLVAGRHDLKMLWLLLFIGFGLLMLGPAGGLHRLLYYIYPPLRFIRHTQSLVLFFAFAFLYFYVLGFNLIFSKWKGNIFNPDLSSRGILSRFIKHDRICKNTAMVLFSACIITSVYWMTMLKQSAVNYLFIFIVIIFIIGWFLRKDLGEKGLYISLIASHMAVVLIFSANTFNFFAYTIAVLGLPFVLFIFIRRQKNYSNNLLRYAPMILLFFFSIGLISELIYNLQKSSHLYQSVKHFGSSLKIDTTPRKPFLPQKREPVFLQQIPHGADNEQSIRYLPLLHRKTVVFSSLFQHARYLFIDMPKTKLSDLKNNSFESWIASSDGSFLPEQFIYHQYGGGSIEKYTGNDGVADGNTSVFLKPAVNGASYIKYQIPNIAEIKGHFVKVEVWVKSQNKTANAIQLYIQNDRVITTPRSSYTNSGEWERIFFAVSIGENTTNSAVILEIEPGATAGVYFDGLDIEVIQLQIKTFEFLLKAAKWNSFLLPKKYFELTRADIPPLAVKEMFAVNKPIFQFKQRIIHVKKGEIPAFLKQAGDIKSAELLLEAAITDDEIEPSLSNPKVLLPEEYQKTSPAVSGLERQGDFTYVIKRYDYDSLDMKVFTDRDGILYWADGYDKGWHAYVNGKESPIYRANVNFKAISLTKGTNNIKFIYNPPFKKALFAFYGTFIVSIMAAAGSFTLSRKTL